MLLFNKEKEKGTTRGRDLPLSCGPKNSVKCMTWGTNPEILKIKVNLAIECSMKFSSLKI